MARSSDNPGGTEAISALESFHHSYRWFIEHVQILSGSAEAQCMGMGDYNVAWELRNDVSAGALLASSDLLSAHQKHAIFRLVESLESLPAEVLVAASGREANLAAMSGECWQVPRLRAAQALDALRSFTEQNALYLGEKRAP
jgi:phosphoribosylcarboxyaminoimidazole (NCAIR) mutase